MGKYLSPHAPIWSMTIWVHGETLVIHFTQIFLNLFLNLSLGIL